MVLSQKDVLKELGLSEGEATVYLSLLKLREAQVNEIKKETKIHRTTIYDFLDKLMKKGLATYVIRNNIKFFIAAHPSKFDELLREKKEHLNEILPPLTKLSELEKKKLKVEIYEGIEGFKTLLNRILKEHKDLLAFGIEEGEFELRFPNIIRQYFKKEQKLGIKERLISRKGTKFIYRYSHMHYKYIDKKFFNPTPTLMFGKNVCFVVWEPLTIIIIENEDLSDAYKKHFELLWRIADKIP